MIGGACFWLTVTLAAAGSVVSAMCIADPVSHPKNDSYYFIGQWFVWLATALLWGTVGLSLAFEQIKPFDLAAVVLIVCISRWASQAVHNLRWNRGGAVRPGFLLSTNSSRLRG